ncbi:hypothetical protein [Gloeobacter kilaueensis]|uniref:Uncharacterized protein n=1 Tax=Gloeobacter kilaueensis (strain ATCC BAA-2537 / CCAP 1431/1 / ULC 316 / JS1) TaxID=1183438 RepID=U5QDH9_GLOK1|nr:hypothetical protein [Gloeobacter kilaueensis]AGY56898.1 hypothetical protein GKIL_0652 [Gloeobacter kilaueensis JS1]
MKSLLTFLTASLLLCPLWVALPGQALAEAQRTGYLVGTREITGIGYLNNGQYWSPSGGTVDISNLPTHPDYVIVTAEAQISVSNSCTGLFAYVNYQYLPFTGAPGGLDVDCNQDGGNPVDQRAYTLASVTRDLPSDMTSLPLQIQAYYGGTNPSASGVNVRTLRLNFYSYNPVGVGTLPVQIVPWAFGGLVLYPATAVTLFSNHYYINIDNQRYQATINSSGYLQGNLLASTTPGRQLSFYLPENSLYQSTLQYFQSSSPSSEPKLVVQGTAFNGTVTYPGVYGNPINLSALNLQQVSWLSGYLIPYPKPATLSATPSASSVVSGSTLNVAVTTSGVDPGSLRLKVGNGAELTPAPASSSQWNDLINKGSTSVAVTVTGSTGRSVPVVLSAKSLASDQLITYSFVVTIK